MVSSSPQSHSDKLNFYLNKASLTDTYPFLQLLGIFPIGGSQTGYPAYLILKITPSAAWQLFLLHLCCSSPMRDSCTSIKELGYVLFASAHCPNIHAIESDSFSSWHFFFCPPPKLPLEVRSELGMQKGKPQSYGFSFYD